MTLQEIHSADDKNKMSSSHIRDMDWRRNIEDAADQARWEDVWSIMIDAPLQWSLHCATILLRNNYRPPEHLSAFWATLCKYVSLCCYNELDRGYHIVGKHDHPVFADNVDQNDYGYPVYFDPNNDYMLTDWGVAFSLRHNRQYVYIGELAAIDYHTAQLITTCGKRHMLNSILQQFRHYTHGTPRDIFERRREYESDMYNTDYFRVTNDNRLLLRQIKSQYSCEINACTLDTGRCIDIGRDREMPYAACVTSDLTKVRMWYRRRYPFSPGWTVYVWQLVRTFMNKLIGQPISGAFGRYRDSEFIAVSPVDGLHLLQFKDTIHLYNLERDTSICEIGDNTVTFSISDQRLYASQTGKEDVSKGQFSNDGSICFVNLGSNKEQRWEVWNLAARQRMYAGEGTALSFLRNGKLISTTSGTYSTQCGMQVNTHSIYMESSDGSLVSYGQREKRLLPILGQVLNTKPLCAMTMHDYETAKGKRQLDFLNRNRYYDYDVESWALWKMIELILEQRYGYCISISDQCNSVSHDTVDSHAKNMDVPSCVLSPTDIEITDKSKQSVDDCETMDSA